MHRFEDEISWPQRCMRCTLHDLHGLHGEKITHHPQRGWFDLAPSKGAKSQGVETYLSVLPNYRHGHRTSNIEF
jgi:hypothetical protein